ncbi:glycosyltransferase family 4 protein [Longimicrobium sp.]|uniref:glycosyltransferase family 4 protein n=1 Tax=Longimicrobium sp. TaxID=2029185 RepID=UPI002C9E7687|nr:glycosyltransferase family 4 protein [Longimicrobium sp.]HSU15222.1 glycosyltransferase family 4 protein [Longimicrobium sp.]
MKRLLTIGHSYVVAMNRRLAHEMAVAGAGEWEVTCVAPARYPGDLRDVELEPIPGEACRTLGIPVRFARRPHLMRYGRELRPILRERWDVVHCWEEPYVLSAAQVARSVGRDAALVCATFQNLPKRYPPPFAQLERRVMRRADGWIAFGRTVEETLQGRPGYRDRPHAVIPPGVDAARFRPDPEARRRVRERLGWAGDGPPVVGYLGRFIEPKGLRVLMRALDGLGGARAMLVGGGEMEGELRDWAAARGDAVRIVTGIPHDAVPEHLAAMDLLVAPSLTTPRWREQFGRMLAEAMASGVPVIGSNSGEIPHVIGDAGAVVREGDADALRTAIRRWTADPAARAEAAARGLERVRTEFALPVVARRHLDFFDAILDRNLTRRRGDAEK